MKKFIYSWSLLIFFAVFPSCIKDEQEGTEIEIGDPVPEFIVYSDDNQSGTTFYSSSFIGKKSLLVFFDIRCTDCQREMPVLEEVWQMVKDDPQCQVVAIARGQGKEETDDFWEKYKLTMPKYLDPDRSVYSLFAPATVPRIYLIDGKGIVQWLAMTKLDVSAEELTQLLLALQH